MSITEATKQLVLREKALRRVARPKACWAGLCLACGKTPRSFRQPVGIPDGSARSDEIGGRSRSRSARTGGLRRPALKTPCQSSGCSCAFAERRMPAKGGTVASCVRENLRLRNRKVFRKAAPNACRETHRRWDRLGCSWHHLVHSAGQDELQSP